jgi:DNA-binding NarL/FixJ family response regulator
MRVLEVFVATRQILDRSPSIRVIALTSFADQSKVGDMLASGAVGYLLKDSEPADLLAAVRSASAGGAPLDPRVAIALLPNRQPASVADQLSLREREVLALASQGLANKQIGRTLGIAERTVKVHLGNVFRRIGVSDRTSAALWARDNLPEARPS